MYMCVEIMSYRSVSIPTELVNELEDLGEDLKMGYSSAAEAVKDAIRWRLEQLRVAKINRKHLEAAQEGV